MTVLRAYFDGKVLVPSGPVDLPIGEELEVQVTPIQVQADSTLLQRLAKLVQDLPANPDVPTDGAAQHDHYLHGLPKKP